MQMKVSRQGRKLIKHFEGFSPTAYKCSAGVWTIGWGNTYINGRPVRASDTVDKNTANKLFREYLARNVIPVISSAVKVKLKQYQVDALASFIYNLGSGAFRNSTLLRLINLKHDLVAEEFSRWVWAGGVKHKGLMRRRQAEKHLYQTGELNYFMEMVNG